MKKYHQSHLIKNIKCLLLLCFLFLGLAGCKGNNNSIQIPSGGSDTGQSGTTTTTTTTQSNNNEQSNIVDKLTAPTLNGHTIALFFYKQ